MLKMRKLVPYVALLYLQSWMDWGIWSSVEKRNNGANYDIQTRGVEPQQPRQSHSMWAGCTVQHVRFVLTYCTWICMFREFLEQDSFKKKDNWVQSNSDTGSLTPDASSFVFQVLMKRSGVPYTMSYEGGSIRRWELNVEPSSIPMASKIGRKTATPCSSFSWTCRFEEVQWNFVDWGWNAI